MTDNKWDDGSDSLEQKGDGSEFIGDDTGGPGGGGGSGGLGDGSDLTQDGGDDSVSQDEMDQIVGEALSQSEGDFSGGDFKDSGDFSGGKDVN